MIGAPTSVQPPPTVIHHRSPTTTMRHQQQSISNSQHLQLQTVDTPTGMSNEYIQMLSCTGQCYLLMNPNDLITQRNDSTKPTTTAATFIPLSRFEPIMPQSQSPTPIDAQYSSKRKVSHNEGKYYL
jgi:hypothetical protein